MAKHNEIGRIGEEIAEKWLKTSDFTIIRRNYWKKFGEIDIVARETDTIHFIEVKSVSYETITQLNYAVSHETWRPEENVHSEKIRRMKNAIQAWMHEHSYKGSIQIDIITVRMVPREKFAQVKLIRNVIFE